MPEYAIQQYRRGWAISWLDDAGKRHRQQLAAADEPSARAEARARWQQGQTGTLTVERIVGGYLQNRIDAGIATPQRQASAWKAMKPYWAAVLPALIDDAMCKAYAASRPVGPATLRYELGMLGVALRWAKTAKLIPDAPVIWRPAAPERVNRALTRPEFRTFLEHVKAPHARLYMTLGLATCARPSALLEITWDRVDFDRGTIDLNPAGRLQNKKRRPVVPIAVYLRGPLLEAYAARRTDHVIERGGKAVANIKKAFSAASKRSGVHATAYTLRHTGAVWRAEDGIEMPELAQLMGHDNSITTEKHYARYTPTYLRKAANAGAW